MDLAEFLTYGVSALVKLFAYLSQVQIGPFSLYQLLGFSVATYLAVVLFGFFYHS